MGSKARQLRKIPDVQKLSYWERQLHQELLTMTPEQRSKALAYYKQYGVVPGETVMSNIKAGLSWHE